jgi:hypothetical protein
MSQIFETKVEGIYVVQIKSFYIFEKLYKCIQWKLVHIFHLWNYELKVNLSKEGIKNQ